MELLKNERERIGFKTRELSILSGIDQALISKFENGKRIPTHNQIEILAQILDIEISKLEVARYKMLLLSNFEFDANLIRALVEIFSEKGINILPDEAKETKIASILDEIELLKNKLTNL